MVDKQDPITHCRVTNEAASRRPSLPIICPFAVHIGGQHALSGRTSHPSWTGSTLDSITCSASMRSKYTLGRLAPACVEIVRSVFLVDLQQEGLASVVEEATAIGMMAAPGALHGLTID